MKYKTVFFSAIILLQFNILFGAFESQTTSTSNLAFGKIMLSGKGNITDIINEPSSIIAFNMKGGEVTWNRPFQLEEFQQNAISAATVYNNWGLGISVSTFGNKIYNESMITASVAKSFKSKLAMGANISLYQLKITDYGTANSTGLSLSLRYNIKTNWNWITTARNINSPKIGETKEKLPQIVTTGFVGAVHDIITIAAEWEQDIEYNGAIKFGILITPIKQFSVSVGYVSDPAQFTAGISVNYNKIYFEYGTVAHNNLGLFTHQLGIGIDLNRR